MIRKIAVIAFFFKPTFGGASTRTTEIVNYLRRLSKEIVIITTLPQYPSGKISDPKYKDIKNDPYIEREGNLTIIRFKLLKIPFTGFLNRTLQFLFFAIKLLLNFGKIGRYIKDADIVYSHTPQIISIILGYIVSKMFGGKHVADIHDIFSLQVSGLKNKGIVAKIISFLLLWLEQVAFRLAEAYSTATISQKIFVQKLFAKKKRVMWIPTPINRTLFFEREKLTARKHMAELGILPREELCHKKLIVYTGIFGIFQGLSEFVNVLAKARENLNDILFVFVGDGEEKDLVLRKIKAFKLRNIVHIHPAVPREIVPYIISMADACLVPLRNKIDRMFALPTKFYEYIACSRPVIATSIGDMKVLINVFNVGVAISDFDEFLMKLNDIKRFLADSKLITNARRMADLILAEKAIIQKLKHLLFQMETVFLK